MVEEPKHVIFNVALSKSSGSKPPHATSGGDCYGDGSSSESNAICDSFPMYFKIDYIRAPHPTKQWIQDSIGSMIGDYTSTDNPGKMHSVLQNRQ
ncbi:hypothetical protein P3T76_006338 [Phytophthora citrophthora]|uniref:Uncharacterized protein n=1 Tax=Phytophthora citrophthora TaxID=4793 RepID=A0AAD9GQ08_9STRA|nr:hypothetical protein P3T76_006338 [Phytophthora citrophthora]